MIGNGGRLRAGACRAAARVELSGGGVLTQRQERHATRCETCRRRRAMCRALTEAGSAARAEDLSPQRRAAVRQAAVRLLGDQAQSRSRKFAEWSCRRPAWAVAAALALVCGFAARHFTATRAPAAAAAETPDFRDLRSAADWRIRRLQNRLHEDLSRFDRRYRQPDTVSDLELRSARLQKRIELHAIRARRDAALESGFRGGDG